MNDDNGEKSLIETGEVDSSTGGSSAPATKTVVVVQYRRGFFTSLAIPVLIMIAAGAILSHRIRIEDWPGLSSFWAKYSKRPKLAEAAEIASSSLPTPEASPSPVIFKVVPRPVDPVDEVAMPAPPLITAAPPSDPPAPAPPPAPVAERVAQVVPPPPPPPVRTEEIWEDIRRESVRKQEEARVLEGEKAVQLELDLRQSEARKAAADQRQSIELDNRRVRFRDELRKALNDTKGRPGATIRDLCARQGVTIGSNWAREPKSPKVLTTAARKERVERMREGGASEAMIVNDLIRYEEANRMARAGAKTQEEAVIRAVRQLLAVPLSPPRTRPSRVPLMK